MTDSGIFVVASELEARVYEITTAINDLLFDRTFSPAERAAARNAIILAAKLNGVGAGLPEDSEDA